MFSKDSVPDQIALLAVYMPILRFHIPSFVRTWNVHGIRKQNNRPYVVHGKPFMNYNYPKQGIRNHGRDASQETLQTLWDDVKDWGKQFSAPEFRFAKNK
jgi:hypothetical protein